MKKQDMTSLVAVVAVGISIFSLVQNNFLKRNLRDLQFSLDSQVSMLHNQVDAIYTNVDDMLKKQASLLSQSSWKYGRLHLDEGKIEVIVSLTPKMYTRGVSEAFLKYENQEMPLSLEGDTFVGSFDIPLGSESRVNMVTFHEKDSVRNEWLDWYMTPYQEFLPQFNAQSLGPLECKNTKTGATCMMKNLVNVNISNLEATNHIQSAEFISILNDKEVSRLPIDLSNLGQQSYLDQSSQYGSQMSLPASQAPVDDSMNPIFYYFDKNFDLSNGSTAEFYVELIDGHNLHYRVLLAAIEIDKDGHVNFGANLWDLIGTGTSIFDDRGHQIYTPERFQ